MSPRYQQAVQLGTVAGILLAGIMPVILIGLVLWALGNYYRPLLERTCT